MDIVEYPWPSTINVGNYITAKPGLPRRGQEGNEDFYIWKEQMVCLLESQEVIGFIDGEIANPDARSAEKQWRRTDRLVKGWILGSIARDTLGLVWKMETARDVWLELDNIFSAKEEEETGKSVTGKDVSRYWLLYKAVRNSDWETANTKFFCKDEGATTAVITPAGETALHVAVSTGTENGFIGKLVELMPRDALVLQDAHGWTALYMIAMVGNTEAAILLVNKNPDSLYICDKEKLFPLHIAAMYCRKETLEYLISVCRENSPFRGQSGIRLLKSIIVAGFFDVALDLARKYPYLALLRDGEIICALSCLANKETAFASRETFSWWQNLVYRRIPIKQRAAPAASHVARDIESASDDASVHGQKCDGIGAARKFESIIWNVLEHLVPKVKDIREKKQRHAEALELMKYLCRQMVSLPQNEAMVLFRFSICMAASNGALEVVEEILDVFPPSYFCRDIYGKNIFQIAASYRFENIFNLIYTMSDRKYHLPTNVDHQGNNLMHVCAKLTTPGRLNLVPGAALQMQRELQWFNEVGKFVSPAQRTFRNKGGKTPSMIFTEEHRELKAEGERWMKDTANACTLAAALIATVVFAAAFTVPGGVASETGVPIFSNEFAFALFAVSDAVSLFTSITSLLMFLSILTSRYAEQDFLHVLPKRLGIGLLCLFVSIAFMMVAFSATLSLVTRGKLSWFITPVTVLACLPVTSFVLLQFPLLVDVIYSTYGPGIFGKKSHDRLRY